MIKFLDLQKVTNKYSTEINNAVKQVVESGVVFARGRKSEI